MNELEDSAPKDLASGNGAGVSRRALVRGLVSGAALAVCTATSLVESASAQERTPRRRPSLAGNHEAVPLPFDPARLRGLSERLLRSHHENNYGGAVRNLNRAEQELSQITPETPPFVVAALRDRELGFRNSKTLHEAYFGNLGGNGRRSGRIEAALAAAYGTTARFEQHFKQTGLGLGGGSGWVVLGYELETGALRVVGAGNHKEALSTAVPLFVMDMYEHSYHIDFGASVQPYIDAFFDNSNWDEVDARLARAERAARELRRR